MLLVLGNTSKELLEGGGGIKSEVRFGAGGGINSKSVFSLDFSFLISFCILIKLLLVLSL
jgi:hypothetical protein